MAVEIFIYYKVAESHLKDAAVAAGRLLDEVERKTGVRGVLMRRADDPQTWMEEYRGTEDRAALLDAIDAALVTSGLTSQLQTPRHVETFVLQSIAATA